jgi:hypothetical protein
MVLTNKACVQSPLYDNSIIKYFDHYSQWAPQRENWSFKIDNNFSDFHLSGSKMEWPYTTIT